MVFIEAQREGQQQHPRRQRERALFEEVREGAARGRGVHSVDQPIEVVVTEEALEEPATFIITLGEDPHRDVPGRSDGKGERHAPPGQLADSPPRIFTIEEQPRHRQQDEGQEAEQSFGEQGDSDG